MKSLRTIILLTCIPASAIAQNTYRAVYTYNIESDMPGLLKEAHKNNVVRNSFDSSDTPEEKQYESKLKREMMKTVYNRCVLNCTCTPAGQYIEMVDRAARDKKQEGMYVVTPSEQKDVYVHSRLIDHTRALYLSFCAECRNKDMTYQLLDTANMRLVPTGSVNEIGGRLCNEYVPADTTIRDISFWTDPQLPDYVNPGIWFGYGAKGGVVAVKLSKSGLTVMLESIKGTDETPRLPKETKKTSKVYNPLSHRIKEIE